MAPKAAQAFTRIGHSSNTRFGGRPSSTASGPGGRGLGRVKSAGYKRHRKIMRDSIRGITKGTIRRLARRGGIKRISATIYEETRAVVRKRLEAVLQRVVCLLDLRHRKTVLVPDVVYALNLLGKPIYGFGEAER